MAIYLNSKKIEDISFGSNKISSIYLGSQLIYSSFRLTDPRIKYFEYTIDRTKKTFTITGIYWDVWYQDYGNYNVYIPDSFEGIERYKVIVVFD